MFVRRHASVMILALTLGAASASAQASPDTVVKTITTPRNRGIAKLVSEMQIGGVNATADEYIFSAISQLLPLSDGSLLLTDRGAGTSVFVRIYDASGKYVRTLGRFGEGPGEYTNPSGLGELPDGRILLRDGRGGRIAAFTKDGSVSQFFSENSNSTSTGSDFVTVGKDGIVYIRASIRVPGVPGPSKPAYLRVRFNGTLIDTIFPPVITIATPPVLTATRTEASGTASSSQGVPFSPSALTALSPAGYFITANSGRYAIDLRMPATRAQGNVPSLWKNGDPITSIRRTLAPVAVNDAERAERRKLIEEQMRTLEPGWNWSGPEIPRVKPVLTSIKTGLDGRIWVQLTMPSEKFDPAKEPAPISTGIGGGSSRAGTGAGAPTTPPRSLATWREPILFDLLEPDGTYVGQVAIPFGVSVLARNGNFVWGVTRDTDDVQTVHRYRIVW